MITMRNQEWELEEKWGKYYVVYYFSLYVKKAQLNKNTYK